MKSLTCVAALVASVIADSTSQKRGGEDAGIPLKQILGDLPAVNPDNFSRWDKSERVPSLVKSRAYKLKDEKYYQLRSKEDCKFPLDIVILQDLTDSFSDNINEMKNVQLKQMVNGLSKSHPNSRFSVVSFQDKPIEAFGNIHDACWSFKSDFSGELEDVYDAYAKSVSYGGWDAPENQFGAIFAALDSGKMSWSPLNSEYARLIVLVTDAGPHHADDGKKPVDNRPMAPWPASYSDADAEKLCLHTAYPSAQQVYDKLVEKQTYFSALVFDGDWANGWAANEWKEFNRFIAQPDGFVEPDAEDSSHFWENLSKIIEVIEDAECTDETTPAPTTTQAVTTQGRTDSTPSTVTSTVTSTRTMTMTAVPPSVSSTTPASHQTATTVGTTTTANDGTTECNPTEITDAPCVPSADNCYCQPEVLIQIRETPDQMKLIADGQVIV